MVMINVDTISYNINVVHVLIEKFTHCYCFIMIQREKYQIKLIKKTLSFLINKSNECKGLSFFKVLNNHF